MSLRMAGIVAGALMLALFGQARAADPSGGDGSDFANEALLGQEGACSYCAPNPPIEAGLPFAFDWSLGLRGGARDTGNGARFELIALPEVWVRQETARGGYELGLSGEVVHDFEGDVRLGALGMTSGGHYELDAMTTLTGRLDLALSQDDPDDLDEPAGVASAPLEVLVDTEASISRDLGPLVVEVRGAAGRDMFGETTYEDGTSTDNDFQNSTIWGAGARLGYRLTPGLLAFIDTQADAEQYDAVSPTLSVKLDNMTYAARAGFSSMPGGVLELEGSIGLGLRDFGSEELKDFSALLYGGTAILRPDEMLSVSGDIATTISSPGTTSGATAKLEHAATGAVNYQLNPWVRLRASIGASTARYEGPGMIENSWGFGTGADYLINGSTDLTADYAFERSETRASPAAVVSAQQEEHQLTVGLRFHR